MQLLMFRKSIISANIKYDKNIENIFKLDTSKYSLFELKAILCNEPQLRQELNTISIL